LCDFDLKREQDIFRDGTLVSPMASWLILEFL
jgi:hypothetical protein